MYKHKILVNGKSQDLINTSSSGFSIDVKAFLLFSGIILVYTSWKKGTNTLYIGNNNH